MLCLGLEAKTRSQKFLSTVIFSQESYDFGRMTRDTLEVKIWYSQKYKTVIFVHGYFWHLHEGCKYALMPKFTVDYWKPKLYRNKERDTLNKKELKEMGWKVLTVGNAN